MVVFISCILLCASGCVTHKNCANCVDKRITTAKVLYLHCFDLKSGQRHYSHQLSKCWFSMLNTLKGIVSEMRAIDLYVRSYKFQINKWGYVWCERLCAACSLCVPRTFLYFFSSNIWFVQIYKWHYMRREKEGHLYKCTLPRWRFSNRLKTPCNSEINIKFRNPVRNCPKDLFIAISSKNMQLASNINIACEEMQSDKLSNLTEQAYYFWLIPPMVLIACAVQTFILCLIRMFIHFSNVINTYVGLN